MSDIDALLHKYADVADRIHTRDTVGDHTWYGMLAAFLMDLNKLPNVVIFPQVPRDEG